MSRMPNVPYRDVPLSVEQYDIQVQKGLYTTDRGVRLAIPIDSIKSPTVFLNRELWRQDAAGRVYRPGVKFAAPRTEWQRKTLEFLRDHVHRDIPQLYYRAVLGHDLHVSTWGDLYAKHWHLSWANPFNPDKVDLPPDREFQTLHDTHWVDHECDLPICPSTGTSWAVFRSLMRQSVGFIEDLGWLSGSKVTDIFVSEEIDELVSATGSEYADFDFHEVGTSTTAENNDHTALQTSTGIARATGTPTDSDPVYQTVATITADTTETWQEHGVFNNSSGAALMDRSLTGGQSVASTDQVQYTYQLTKNPEA